MIKYKIALNCPNCRTLIVHPGWVADYGTDALIINLSAFECERFDCPHCGTTVYTGDADSMYEVEDPPEDFVPEDDEECWDDDDDEDEDWS